MKQLGQLLLLCMMVCQHTSIAQAYHSKQIQHTFSSTQFKFSKSKNTVVYQSKSFAHELSNTTPFIAISAKVNGKYLEHEKIAIMLYGAEDGSNKKKWIELEDDHHIEQSNESIVFPPVYLNSTTQKVKYKIILKSNSIQLNSIEWNFFVPAEVQPHTTDAIDENSSGRACSCNQPSSVSRSSWGSSYGLSANSSCSSVSYTTVSHLIVHHAAGSNTSTNWAGVVASIWNYHVNTNGWCDVGYNWLIDPNGVLYVGRGGGNNVVGAHMCGYNQKTMGICLLGNYNTATPSNAAMNKLAELLAWKCCNSNINPLGSGAINSYPGTMDNISGHRQGCAPGYTDCPGNNLFSQLSNLRSTVNNFINNGCSFTSTPSNPANDYCSGAIELASSSSCNYQSFNNANASGSLPATSPCNGFTNGVADDDVWFKFTAVSTEHSVQLLNGTSFDGVVDVRSGTCNSSTSIGCDDQPGNTGITNTVNLNSLSIGNTYFIRVYHYGTGSGGSNFQICVRHPTPPCAFTISSDTTFIDSNQTNLSVQLNSTSNCAWNASAGCNFVSLNQTNGTGSSTIGAIVSENNDTSTRICTINIADKTFTVVQSGKKAAVQCNFLLSADSIFADSSIQTVSLVLQNSTSCNWSVVPGCGFLSANPTSGNLSDTIYLTLSANSDTLPRQCNILVADRNIVVIQTGSTYVNNKPDSCTPALPKPPIVANGCDLASSPAIPNVTYDWYKNGVLIPAVNSRFYTVEDDRGYFYVEITDAQNCKAVSDDIYVDCTLPPSGLASVSGFKLITIQPNPVINKLSVKVETDVKTGFTIKLLNPLGQLLSETTTKETTCSIDTSPLSSGLYIIQLLAGNAKYERRIVVSK